jgi:hypothetical protein
METVCCIKGCDLTVVALGLCVNHWRMTVKHGSPVAQRPLSAINRGLGDEHRFWKSVHKGDGCWLWTAGRDDDGYGRFKAEIFGVLVFRAHRYSHILATGELLTPDRLVMHSCDNPPCVNPAHLSSGTGLENTLDMIIKGRHLGRSRAHADKVAKLSDDQVRAILRDGRPYAKIAAEFDVHPQTVMALKARTSRTYVEIDPADIVRNKRGARGAAKSKLLTDADVQAIRVSDERTSVLARQYGVSAPTICDIRKLRSWTHLPAPAFVTSPDRPAFEAPPAPARRHQSSRACSVDGCDCPVKARGLCQTHYVRVLRTGSVGVAERLSHGGPQGATHHKVTLTEDQARAIKFSTEKGVVLAARFGVTPVVISSIRTGRTWKHVI